MELLKITTITCEQMEVAATVEADSSDPHPIYYPSNVLFFMQRGQLNVTIGQQLHSVPRGSFALIRKYTHCQCFKTWTEEEGSAVMIAFALQDDFLQRVLERLPIATNVVATNERIVPLPPNALLHGLMQSIWAYIQGGASLDRSIIELKTMEALLAIGATRPDLVMMLKEYSQPERADLEQFMQHNFKYNIALDKLARMSGRSLSTFNREFKALFQTSPHKWIKQQRLEMARRLLIQTPKTPSDVYLEVGFEDLAHFSRSFKRHFGKNPSEVKRMIS